jgi:F0F1-type ATP synthase membrane subunit a
MSENLVSVKSVKIVNVIGHWYYGFTTGNTWQDNMRETFENWQSEFLQLIWQVVALTYLGYIGSPQSKEKEERNQEMLEWIMKRIDRQKAEEFMRELEQKYQKK